MADHYDHKHMVDVTDQTIKEFGAGFCTQCGEIVDTPKTEKTDDVAIDSSLITELRVTHANAALLEQQIAEAMPQSIVDMQNQLTKMRDQDAYLRSSLKKAMASTGIKKFSNDWITITYVAPSVRKGFDSARFRKEQPEMYDNYLKLSDVSDSVRITIKLEGEK